MEENKRGELQFRHEYESEYFPAAQELHDDCPMLEKKSGVLHGIHAIEPKTFEYVPAGQGLHIDCPVAFVYVPTSQG